MKNVVLLIGSWPKKTDIDLSEVYDIEHALIEIGYKVNVINVSNGIDALRRSLNSKSDVVFNVLNDKGGENGDVLGLLENLQIPYTHSNVVATVIAADNHMSRVVLSKKGILCLENKDGGEDIIVTVLGGKAQGVTAVKNLRVTISETDLQTFMIIAEKIYRELSCSGFICCYFKYRNNKDIYFDKVDTVPSLKNGSAEQKQIEQNGMSLSNLCSYLVKQARCHN